MSSADVMKELLDCSICLNIYTDPVTLRCGHSFCLGCIDHVLDSQEGTGHYSCPECRAESVERPPLMRNMTMCNIVESFLPTQPHQQESGVLCTYCVDFSVPAVKSCLLCEASLCDKHLRVHSKSPEHIITDPTTSLGSRKCSVHKKILEYYCPKDKICVCVSCSLTGEHRGHKVEMLGEAFSKKKKKLRKYLQGLITERVKAEERVQRLKERMKKTHEKAADVAERVTALFTDIRKQLEDLEKKVLCEVSRQEGQMSSFIFDMIQKLELKKEKLSRKRRHIEGLCNTMDPLTVLMERDAGNLCDPDGKNVDSQPHTNQLNHGTDLDVAPISPMLHKLSEMTTEIKSGIYTGEPADLLLDVNTANNYLLISDDKKTVTSSVMSMKRPATPLRFQTYCNVISSQRFSSGWYYWEAECSDVPEWKIGMCYPSIDRRGNHSNINNSHMCWCLWKRNDRYLVAHDCKVIRLPHKISSNRVRICLDYEAGQLSFYELCDPIRHLHTFTATFTEPLHAVLSLYWRKEGGDWFRILNH
ncbi:E3 ubiquitin/ISG15 ligase TRIM25-like [Hyperolius riggenbachi]|uniref:E3 ubiquitin/ISG15 ligase TRIM25-like n=1 Tax=Hyperolius riggenbachi TaxID=752182 RepID=UPI0035A274B7